MATALKKKNDPPGSVARPSAKVIAFAVSIVRSKPQELSIGEYIRLLREHFAKGRRDTALSSKHRHLDRSSYWRSEYERAKERLNAFEGEIINLHQEIDSLKARGENARRPTAAKKRKRQDDDIVPVPRSPKKTKRDTLPNTRSTRVALELSVDAEFNAAGELGNVLLRSVYHIHAIIKTTQKTDPLELAYHLRSAALTLPQIVLREIDDDKASGLADLQIALNVAGRAASSILVGFNRLSHVPEGNIVQRGITYAIVQMFKSLVAGLEHLSAKIARTVTNSDRSAAATQKTSERSRAKVNARVPNVQACPALELYTSFLSHLVQVLDPKVDSNKALFEGYTYCILDRLGGRLFNGVFGHARGTTMEEEILAGRKVADEIEDSEEPSPEDLRLKQVVIEAPYLVHLLKKIMLAAPAYLGSSGDGKTKQPAKKHSLSIAAKERLQRSLINSIFGAEGMDEENPFIDCLQMPRPVEDAVVMPKVKEVKVQDWFAEEVWCLLGWGILAQEQLPKS